MSAPPSTADAGAGFAVHAPVLLVEIAGRLRRDLAAGLTRDGYEVVPAVSAAEGRRFAGALEPALVVAPASIADGGDGRLVAELAGGASGPRRTLVLLGEALDPPDGLPSGVVYLPVTDLASETIVRKLRLALLARETGLEPDERLEALVGDVSLQTPLDLVRLLARARATARIQLAGGAIVLADGAVVTARAGGAHGAKAFYRLSRTQDGLFRIRLGGWDAVDASGLAPPEHAIRDELRSLLIGAVEDGGIELPDPRAHLELEQGPEYFSTTFTPLQQRILSAAGERRTIGELLDEIDAPDGAITAEVERLERHGVLRRVALELAVQVFTDSAADLPAELARQHGIHVVPLTVRFGGQVFRDGEDLQPGGFYRLLADGDAQPETGPVTVREFSERYWEIARRCDVVSVHLSGKLSRTVENARQAVEVGLVGAAEVRSTGAALQVEVIDSAQVSTGLGMLALFAARMAARGWSAAAIGERLRSMAPRVRTMFVLETLEYVARGGRVGRAQAFLAAILGMRPVLCLEDGEVAPLERVRGARSALPRLAELAAAGVDRDRAVVVGIGHAQAPARAEDLRRLVEERLTVSELILTEIGPTVGTHAGPGCVGVSTFQPADAEEADLVAPLGAGTALAAGRGVVSGEPAAEIAR